VALKKTFLTLGSKDHRSMTVLLADIAFRLNEDIHYVNFHATRRHSCLVKPLHNVLTAFVHCSSNTQGFHTGWSARMVFTDETPLFRSLISKRLSSLPPSARSKSPLGRGRSSSHHRDRKGKSKDHAEQDEFLKEAYRIVRLRISHQNVKTSQLKYSLGSSTITSSPYPTT